MIFEYDEHTLFIHCPTILHDDGRGGIKRIVHNGVEYPIEGCRRVVLEVEAGDIPRLTIDYHSGLPYKDTDDA